MISKEERELISAYKKDFLKQTGKVIKCVECSKWEQMVYFTENVEFSRLVEVICDATGWPKEDVFRKCRKEEIVLRRSIIDFIAINNGCKLLQVGRATGRDHTTVINSIQQMEARLESVVHYRTLLREIMDYIHKNWDYYVQPLDVKLKAV